MSAAAKKLVPAIAPERNATCSVCNERALCAAIANTDVRICSPCAQQAQQVIASVRPPSARPHRRPCTCQVCVIFDEGQRREFVKPVLVPLDDDEQHGSAAAEQAATPSGTRFSWLEVD